MKKLAFWIRLALLAVFPILPALHPGVLVAFDASRLWLSFVLIPASCVLAWYGPRMPRFGKAGAWIPVAAALAGLTLAVDGLTVTALSSLASALAAYAVTALAFRGGWNKLLYVEPVYFLWCAWRLSEFSRSSAVIAEASRFPVAVIFFACFASWVLYAVIVYRLDYERETPVKPSRVVLPALASLAFLALFSFALFSVPEKISFYVQKLNASDERLPPKGGEGTIKGGGRAESGKTKSNSGRVVRAADRNWQQNPGSSSGDGNQHMVMIVESPVDVLYLARDYRGLLDPVKGFEADPSYFANSLATAQYLETWVNPDVGTDKFRTPVWVEVHSSIPDKLTSWLPDRIEPTVLDEKNFPLRYSYRAMSLVSNCSLTGKLPFIPPLAGKERESLSSYLALPLAGADIAPFRKYMEGVLAGNETYAEKIGKILESFKNCRYEAGGADEMTVAVLKNFLFGTRVGDCSEFSNTAALLARLAGIPSRVVTGYAVRKDLQTAAHREGIRKIMEKFPPLAGKNPERLFLVTTAHSHSWAEFYIPGSGWVDFETTSRAIAPEAGRDPNGADIVIPEFDSLGEDAPSRISFPWLLAGKIALLLFAAGAVFWWLRRMATLLALSVVARRGDSRGAKARFRIFLVRLAARGYRAKRHDETPREYGLAFPELADIMDLYEFAVFHPESATRASSKIKLDRETAAFLASRRSPLSALREISGIGDGGLV
jgi:transglutaminase-like putative cysteine protease